MCIRDRYLLAVCFGGVILGAGVGLVIRFGGCLDGTETVAILINRKFKLPVGQTVLIFNVIIYIVAALLFGFDRAMYSLLTYFITSKIIDKVETGLEQAKAAMILSLIHICTKEYEGLHNMYKKSRSEGFGPEVKRRRCV